MQTFTFTKKGDYYFVFYFPETGTLCIKADLDNEAAFACMELAPSTDDFNVIKVTKATVEYEGGTGSSGRLRPIPGLSNQLRRTLNYFKCNILDMAKDQFFGFKYSFAPITDDLPMMDEAEFYHMHEETMDEIMEEIM